MVWSCAAGGGRSDAWRAGLEFVRVGPAGREAIRRYLRERSLARMVENYADLGAKNLRRVFTG